MTGKFQAGRFIAGLALPIFLACTPLPSLPLEAGDPGCAARRSGEDMRADGEEPETAAHPTCEERPADPVRKNGPPENIEPATGQEPAKTTDVDRSAPALLRLSPVFFYDSDAGLGYGGRIFLRSVLRFAESFDLLVYHTDRRDRRIRFATSWPDAELRRGRTYPFAFDLAYDFGKTSETAFFGVGNGSKFEAREYYTREPSEISAFFSTGLSPRTAVRFGMRYRSIVNSGFSPDSRLAVLPPPANASKLSVPSLFAGLVFDSLDSLVHPSCGFVAEAEVERAPDLEEAGVSLLRLSGRIRFYTVLLEPRTILAVRFWGQAIYGDELPVQVLLPLGGRETLRGSARFRFLDQTFLLLNTELRIPVYRRLGAILGLDTGKVWASPRRIDWRGWTMNPVFGLRFITDSYILRADVGLGRESTGVYITAGHMF